MTNKTTTLIIKTDRDVLARLMDDYSDNGYTNTHSGDIIIDLDYVEDDPDQLAHFFEITGLTKSDLTGVAYICFYS